MVNDSSLTPSTIPSNREDCFYKKGWAPEALSYHSSLQQLRTAAMCMGIFPFPSHTFGANFQRLLPFFQMKIQILDKVHNNQAIYLPSLFYFFHHTKCAHRYHHHRHHYKILGHLSCLLLPKYTFEHWLISAAWVSIGPAGDSAAHRECFGVLRAGPHPQSPWFGGSVMWTENLLF